MINPMFNRKEQIFALAQREVEHDDNALTKLMRFEEEYSKKTKEDKIGPFIQHNVSKLKDPLFEGMPHTILGQLIKTNYRNDAHNNEEGNSVSEDGSVVHDGIISSVDLEYYIIRDNMGNHINCFAIPKDAFPEINNILAGQFVLLIGSTIRFLIPAKTIRYEYSFYLKDIITEVKPIHQVDTRGYLYTQIEAKIQSIQKNWGLRNYIKSTIVERLNLKRIEESTELRKALDFIIIQAFSHGLKDKRSNKLHSLVIGPPSVGKSILNESALILNSVGYVSTSNKQTMSVAGLVGSYQNTATKYNPGYNYIQKGIFPKAHNGIVCFEDFHNITKGESTSIVDLFTEVMEKGTATRSTVNAIVAKAATAIHIDMNRLSQVLNRKSTDLNSDINIPLNIISRIDFITDIKSNVDELWERAREVFSPIENTLVDEDIEVDEWKQNLKIFVAFAVSNYDDISFSNEINSYVQTELDKFKESISNTIDDDVLASMLGRLPRSIKKISRALACSELTNTVTREHIDKAFEIAYDKFDFVKGYNASNSETEQTLSKGEKRIQLITELFDGIEVTFIDIHEELSDHLDEMVSERTIRRDIKDMMKDDSYDIKKIGDLICFGSDGEEVN